MHKFFKVTYKDGLVKWFDDNNGLRIYYTKQEYENEGGTVIEVEKFEYRKI